MQGMFCEIRSESCGSSVTQSASNSMTLCSAGRPVCARPMAFGQSTGTTKWQDRHHSSPANREKELSRIVSAKSTSNAVNATNDYMNTDCTDVVAPRTQRSQRLLGLE